MPGGRIERGFHSLRHTFISALAAADIPAKLRMKLSGHADLKSHTGYTHTETRQLAEALKRVKIYKLRFFIDNDRLSYG
ncbi:MAG: tyrosine-type recombinase/integrase [Verrucomicrobiota bacterium]